MNSDNKMWKNDCRVAYETLWNGFVSGCEASGCIVKPRQFAQAVRCEALKKEKSKVTMLAYLREVPFRGAKTNEKVEMLVRASETMSADWAMIEASHVTVSYIDPGVKPAQLLQSIHYDFEGVVQAAHPWFHAQLGVDLFEDDERKRMGCSLEIKRDLCHPMKTLRIATPHMGLPSVILGIAADHLKQPTFESLVKKMSGLTADFPSPHFDRMKNRLQRTPSQFANLCWFDESQ